MENVTFKHLNADTSWLLTFHPSTDSSRPFNLVIDPWFTGPQIDFHPLFSRQHHVVTPLVTSIPELIPILPGSPGKIDAILITHHFSDHCHFETLEQADRGVPVFATKWAAEKLRSWGHFERVVEVPMWKGSKGKEAVRSLKDLWEADVGRVAGSSSRLGTCWMPDQIYLTHVVTDKLFGIPSLHGSTIVLFGLTSRSSAPEALSDVTNTASENDLARNATLPPERLGSIIYAPHGIPPSPIISFFSQHPSRPTPLALVQSLDSATNPAWLGGPINLGTSSALPLIEGLKRIESPQDGGGLRLWIGTHEEEKKGEGLVGWVLKNERRDVEGVQAKVDRMLDGSGDKVEKVKVVRAGVGADIQVWPA